MRNELHLSRRQSFHPGGQQQLERALGRVALVAGQVQRESDAIAVYVLDVRFAQLCASVVGTFALVE